MSETQTIQCPLCNVERRLDDALLLWKEAESAYFTPDKFRAKLNACIQALRTVTFVLQKNQVAIKGFDTWYATQQNSMRENKVLRWLVEARNQIEKQGDLDGASIALVSLHTSWFRPPVYEVQVPPKTKPERLGQVLAGRIPKTLVSEGSLLRIERCWRDAKLPEMEILDALRICYRDLARVLVDAHLHLVDSADRCASLATLKEHAVSYPKAMQSHSSHRFVWIKLRDNDVFTIKSKTAKLGSFKKLKEQVTSRYGFQLPHLPSGGDSLEARVRHFFEAGKMMLAKDGYHLPFGFIISGNSFEIHELRMADRAEKHAMIRHLADQVRELKANQFIFVNEVWTAMVRPGDPLVHAADDPNRGEGFKAEGVDATGKAFSCFAGLERKHGKVILNDEVLTETKLSNILLPILEAMRSFSS
jgi:hypothetical protein